LRELLLGDVHTELMARQQHRPTSFQDPLRDTQVRWAEGRGRGVGKGKGEAG
jgi:hypothetical protein